MSTLPDVSKIFTPDMATRDKVMELEAKMLQSDQIIHIEPRHIFAEGLYSREIFIPKGTLLTGLIHKVEHINFISQGEILVLTDEGPERLKAPTTIVSKPGIKRVGYALEDTVWTTVHAWPSKERDVKKIEEALVTNSFDDLELTEKLKEELCLT